MTRALIGRDHPAGILRAEIGRAVDSHGGLVLVTGEAGIGKTTLVTGAAEDAKRFGALVLSGSCWDSDSAPGYWPWVQVIRALRRGATPQERAAAEEAAGNSLAVLLGESQVEEAADGFQLYDAVTTALVSVSHSRPVVVVLDDLHWADTASVKLLEFAAQHTWFERLLLIGTYRDVEVEAAEHPLRPLIVPLLAKATTVTLTGLARDDVGALMARTVGREPEGDLVAEVHRRTGGNPFFVEQTARLWHSGGSITAIAPGVRDALRRRLSLLPEPVVRLLTVAAVLGREFHRQVLAATAAAPVPHVDRLLDEAVAARLVLTLGAGRFSFAHDLVRETLYDSLDDAQARGWHAAVVRALDRSAALAERILPGDLARHAYLAGEELEPARAVDLLLAAARDASGRLAAEESIGHYRRAYERAVDTRKRIMIALDLASAQYHVGDREEAWNTWPQAVALARELDDPELLARVALTMYGYRGTPDQKRFEADLLEQAHEKLVSGTATPDGQPNVDRLAQELTVRVAMLARRGEDDEALGFSLWARHNAIWGPGSASERLALTDELLAVARRAEDQETEFLASSFRWVALLELGDPRYLDQFNAFLAIATAHHRRPLSKLGALVDHSIIATLCGRFKEAEAMLEEAVTSFEQHQHVHFAYMTAHLRWALLLLSGRFDEAAELLRSLDIGGHPCPRLLEAITAVQRGDVDVAVRHVAEVAARDEPYSRFVAPLWARFLAQTAAATRDPELCEQARTELASYGGTWSVSLWGCDISGPMAHWSALVDAAQERWDDAIDGFTAAYTAADRMQARPWSIEARSELAGVLLARGRPGDTESGTALLGQVEREATEIGMRHIIDRCDRLRSTMDGGKVKERAAANEFRFTGEVWTLTMDGRTVHLPDTKGLRDIHNLLGRPGTDVPAVELLDPRGGQLVIAARRMGGDAVLDEEARTRYKRRLAVLDEQIDEAMGRGDDHRAAALDRERAALLDELRAAAGLAGRSRRLGDETERARKTVTARIRDTLRKLDDRHPELAVHLRATVSTGVTCRYQPEREITWRR